jgi:kinesin family protein 11
MADHQQPETFQVFVRCRPQIEQDQPSAEEQGQLEISDNSLKLVKGRKEFSFSYDAVFDGNAEQSAVYARVHQFTQMALNGVNCTVFAYGHTGTGKTYTMSGGRWTTDNLDKINVPRAAEERKQKGMIERAFEELCVAQTESKGGIEIKVSFLEVYNEKVHDLLSGLRVAADAAAPDRRSKGDKADALKIKLGSGGQAIVEGLTSVPVSEVSEMQQLLEHASSQRAVRDTMFNEHSSRSHTVFQVMVERKGADGKVQTASKLSFVDLAGSERCSKATGRPASGNLARKQSTESHFVELSSINRSLSTLGHCIQCLSEPGRAHIPYRDSVLTRLLQDSLGGHARCVFLVTVSASTSPKTLDETHSTLKFADRAKCVITCAKRQVVSTGNPVYEQRLRYSATINLLQRVQCFLSSATLARCMTTLY